jgi:hypothetical protein
VTAHTRSQLVLAIHPFARGFAFALFEAPLSPVDWGIKEILGAKRNARSVAAARALVAQVRPGVVVFENGPPAVARRSPRIQRLRDLMVNYFSGQSIEVRFYGRENIRACFAHVGAVTRREIAEAIAAQLPAFEAKLPRVRKTWESEDPRMALFNAASLALTHYYSAGLASDDGG